MTDREIYIRGIVRMLIHEAVNDDEEDESLGLPQEVCHWTADEREDLRRFADTSLMGDEWVDAPRVESCARQRNLFDTETSQ